MTEASNFSRFSNYDALLSHIGRQAEIYAHVDPSVTLLKLRIFCERLVARAAASRGVLLDPHSPLIQRIRDIEQRGVVTRAQAGVLHALRRAGNLAAHGNAANARDARRLLESAFEVTTELTGSDGGPFELRPPKSDEGAFLRRLDAEMKALRDDISRLLKQQTADASDRRELAAQIEQLLQQEREKVASSDPHLQVGSDGQSTIITEHIRRRRPWNYGVTRPGWETEWGTAGGTLRSAKEIVGGDLHASLSQVAVYSTGPRVRADEAAQQVALLLQRIVQRGDQPPVSPEIETLILTRAGLEFSPHPDPSIAEVVIDGPLPPMESRRHAALFREPFVPDLSARLLNGEPALHADAEQPFFASWISENLDETAGHWFTPQAPLEALVQEDDSQGDSECRVDFLLTHPLVPPTVIEIDGSQHVESVLVDEDRAARLGDAGFFVFRRAASDAGPTSLKPLRLVWPKRDTRTVPELASQVLVWGPAIANRILLGIATGIRHGWLHGNEWDLEVEAPCELAVACVQDSLRLLAAYDAVLGTGVAPLRVGLRSHEQHVQLERGADGDYLPTLHQEITPPSFTLTVDCFRGPFHALPTRTRSHPHVVIRSAALPLDVLETNYLGDRQVATPSDKAPAWALRRILTHVFGKRQFRDGQEQAIKRIVRGRDTVVLLPTGAGKSLIYQLAAFLVPGVTLVIDPIVALIDDQIAGLRAQGIDRGIGVTSTDTQQGTAEAKLTRLKNGDTWFVFVAPERLQQRRFREALRELCVSCPVNTVVVDEAHCVSEWGHDFRTSYLDLGRVLREHTSDMRHRAPPLLALSGTASRAVLKDMLNELGIDRSDADSMVVPRSFDREELKFDVLTAKQEDGLALLSGLLKALPHQFSRIDVPRSAEFYEPRGSETCCGVVFCQTKNGRHSSVKGVSEFLRTHTRIRIRRYAGGSGLVSPEERRSSAALFKQNQATLLVSTKAYGMGIDKPNIRYVIHYGIPSSIEAYYQEAGRAGRDRREARCVIIHSPKDKKTLEWFHSRNYRGVEEDLADVRLVAAAIRPVGSARRLRIPLSIIPPQTENDDNAGRIERAIHRLKLLGVIDTYLVEWGSGFELFLRDATVRSVNESFLLFIRRAQPARVPAFAADLASDRATNIDEVVLRNARRLIAFVYETVVASRRRAMEEMARLSSPGATDGSVRSGILEYLRLEGVSERLEPLLNKEAFSFDEWLVLYATIQEPEDASEWRGATARLLESYPDHPGLLVGRGLAECAVANGREAVFLESLSEGWRSAALRYMVSHESLVATIQHLSLQCEQHRPDWLPTLLESSSHSIQGHLDCFIAEEERILACVPIQPRALSYVLDRRLLRHSRDIGKLAELHAVTS